MSFDFSSPFGQTNMPGMNPGGSNMSVPTAAGTSTPAIGGSTNPFTPSFPGGANTPPMTSTINNAGNFNVSSLLGFGQGTNNPLHDITKALGKAGFSAGVAGELANFLQSGAGFNPAVAQALIAAMQPGVQRKGMDILEQFSSMGLRGSSAGQIAYGDFMAQEQLNEDQIWAQMYEQSVQNYMNVLLAGKGNPPKSGWDKFMDIFKTTSSFAGAFGGGGKD